MFHGINKQMFYTKKKKEEEEEATVRTRHGATDWFKLGKKYVKAIYCHLDYLTYMQSTS